MPVWRLSCSGSSVELLKHQLFIGRDDDCELTIKHKGIDIRHAVLNYDQRLGVFRLTDLGSSYGTFVNGESVGEESVPLYVGTRIMFGKNPNIWRVEVGEASVKPYIPEPSPQQLILTTHQQQVYHSLPPSLVSHAAPYSSPSAPPPLSHSFQTIPTDTGTPGSCAAAGKSYFGDPTSLQDRDSSPYLRGNESFVPARRAASSQISFSEIISSSPLLTNSCSRASNESHPETSRARSPPEDTRPTNQESTSRDVPTRARTLYGQPSWWGDGSDDFSTPPSHRKYTKRVDTPHPNTSVNPPTFPPNPHPVECRDLPPEPSDGKERTASPDDSKLSGQQSQDSRDSRSSTKFFISIDPGEIADEPPMPPENKPRERSGSYEIPSEELDSSLSRPVIDPDPAGRTPPRSRKSEVFVVELGEASRKQSRSEPRVLFTEDKNILLSERLCEKDSGRKVRLAFRETEPILSTPQPTSRIHSEDLDTDAELEFMTPYAKPPRELQSPQMDSLLSDRGEEIGDPVTSSTPISMTSSESQLMSPPVAVPLPPPSKQGAGIRDTLHPSMHKKGRRKAWNIPQQSLDPGIIQTINEVTHSIEEKFDQVCSQASCVSDVLNKHFGDVVTPFSVPNLSEDFSDSPELETASQEVVEIVSGLKRIEAKVENFSKQHGSSIEELQEVLNKLKTVERSEFDTPEVPTHDQGVRKGSFEADRVLPHSEVTEQLKRFSDLSFPH